MGIFWQATVTVSVPPSELPRLLGFPELDPYDAIIEAAVAYDKDEEVRDILGKYSYFSVCVNAEGHTVIDSGISKINPPLGYAWVLLGNGAMFDEDATVTIEERNDMDYDYIRVKYLWQGDSWLKTTTEVYHSWVEASEFVPLTPEQEQAKREKEEERERLLAERRARLLQRIAEDDSEILL